MSFGNECAAWRRATFGGVRLVYAVALLLICSLLSCTEKRPVAQKKIDSNEKKPAAAEDKRPAKPDARAAGGFANFRPAESAPPVMLDAPKFKLIDQTGAAFGTDELRDCVWVVNFMFTKCTATCPQQTANIVKLQQHASRWPDWERVRLVSISVDPQHDTAAQLHEYAERFGADHAHWKFLTGQRAELFRICEDGFKLPVKDTAKDAAEESALDASTPITHSPRFVLVDAELRIRGYYDGLSDKDVFRLLADMRFVLGEEAPGTKGIVHICQPPDVFDPPWLDGRKAAQLAAADEIGAYHDFDFTDGVDASGIQFVNRAVADATWNWKPHHYDHGNGLAAADVDGDGLIDLYFVNQVGGNELWRNLGNGRFENFTEQAGVALRGRVGVSASFADTDNDGDADLFVTTTRHGNAFFENDGQGHFQDVTLKSGLDYTGHSSSAEFFDYDRDGRLDLFLTNVGVFTTDEIEYSEDLEKRRHPFYVGMRAAFTAHLFPERSEKSILYHNDRKNSFRDVSTEMGLVHKGWSGDATPMDVNDDGWIDLYVLGMQGNDEYYENIEGKRFELKSRDVFPESPWGGMGVKSFDYNNDGRLDIFVTNMHGDMFKGGLNGPEEKLKVPSELVPESLLQHRNKGKNIFGNAFYENRGEGQFQEVSGQINAENCWPWGLSVGDLNADGYQDMFITSSMNLPYRYHVNSLLLNDRGQKFRDAEFILGVEPRRDGRTATPWYEVDCSVNSSANNKLCEGRSGRVQVWAAIGSRSSVIFDLDQDGDLDIVTNDFHSRPMVLISSLSERNPNLHYLKIRLQGTRANRAGLGAKVQVTAAGQTATQVHDGQSGYLSQSALPLYFGLSAHDTIDRVSVQWPGGNTQVIEGPILSNQELGIIEEYASP
jgi:cytochrome oxidase Cu insertion factor (SCO1/SenC/PrrC family)